MKKFLLWIFLFYASLQFSCTSELYINTTLPARVPIAFDQWKVVAINRYNPALLPFDGERIMEVYADGAQEAFYGVQDAILDDSTYLLVHADSTNYRIQSLGEDLSREQIKQIYEEYPFHLLVSLDHFDVELDQETVRTDNSDGSVSQVAYFTLIVHSSWTLFDSTGAVLDKVTLMRDEAYQSRPVLFGILAIGPALSKAGPAINRLAWNTGYDYWTRLSPQPITFIRPYYSTGKFKDAAAAMAAEEWKTAISLLTPLTEGKKKDAAKAAFNLAVVYEAMGSIEQAIHWASEASLLNDPMASWLLVELEKYGQ